MFQDTKVSDLTPISGWDTSKAVYMNNMFQGTEVSDLTPISGWDVSSVTSMAYMFSGTDISDLTPISGWDVSKVYNFNYMFDNCSSLSKVDVIAGWNISQSQSNSGYSRLSNMFNIYHSTYHPDSLLRSTDLPIFTLLPGHWEVSDLSGTTLYIPD